MSGYNVYRGTSPGVEGPSPINGGTLVVSTAYNDTTASRRDDVLLHRPRGGWLGQRHGLGRGERPDVSRRATGLNAAPVSTSEIDLAWTAPSGAVSGYNVYRGTSPGDEDSSPINGSTLVASTTYDDTTASAGTTYYYTVQAVNGSGSGAASNEAIALTYPAAPTGLGATPISASEIDLAWTAPSGAVSGYNVYRGTNPGVEGSSPINGGTLVATTAYNDTTASAGTTYYYTVKAANGSGTGTASNEAHALTYPAAPTGLGAAPVSAGEIDLAWTAPSGTVSGYNVYRGTSPGDENPSPINGGALVATTAYNDTTASAGTTYYYTVEAVNGSGSGMASAEVSALTYPAAPTGLGAAPVSASEIDLAWTAPSGTVSGYNVYRGTSPGAEGPSPINGTLVATATYNDTTASAGTTYYYTVQAVDGSGGGMASNEASALTYPAAPTGLGATPISASEIDLAWTAPSGAVSGYNVYRGTSPGEEGPSPINGTLVAGTAYNDTTASAGTTYYYTVQAVDGSGSGMASAEVIALTYPAAPTGLGAAPVSASEVDLTWSAPSGAVSGYNVYRGTSPGEEGPSPINGTLVATASYNDTTACAGTAYYYTVQAVNGSGSGTASVEVSALTYPAAPTDLGATPVSATQTNLSWTAPGGAVSGYNVYRGTSPGAEGSAPINSGTLVATTAYNDTAAIAGTTYYYTVEAVNASGSGTASVEVIALTYPARADGVRAPCRSRTTRSIWRGPPRTAR